MIRRMRFACWINKPTDTHTEYVTFSLSNDHKCHANAPQVTLTFPALLLSKLFAHCLWRRPSRHYRSPQQLHTAYSYIIRHLYRRHQNVKCTHFVRLSYHFTAFILFTTYEWETFLYLLSVIKRKTCVSMVTQYIICARGRYTWKPSAVIRRLGSYLWRQRRRASNSER